MAMEYFRRKNCSLAVLEVGMGGRLDATNTVTPRIAIITEIDGIPNRQSCMVTAQPGMRIRRQRGARDIDPDDAPEDLPSFPAPAPRSGGA